MKKECKKAVSPVITTVLLVMIVIVLASLIVVWGTTFIPEKLSKFGNPIENECSNVQFSATSQGTDISIVNTGDTHIYKVGVRAEGAAKSTIKYEDIKLNPGSVATISPSHLGDADSAIVIPVLLAETEGSKIQEFSCSQETWRTVGL